MLTAAHQSVIDHSAVIRLCPMETNLLQFVESATLDPTGRESGTRQIYDAVLDHSATLDCGNFTRIHTRDLEILFDEYDARFFDDRIRKSLGGIPLHFRLSNRMTTAGGKTTRLTRRDKSAPASNEYEIAASTTLLFQCFGDDDHRPITACGITCRDRLEALQRVMEHELIHLTELLLWNTSSCSQGRFHRIAGRFFGHTEHKHQLITPRERAFVKFGVKRGDRVRFRFHGVDHTGIVNRVTKRATVLVEDPQGVQYSNGIRYKKYYVPVEILEGVD